MTHWCTVNRRPLSECRNYAELSRLLCQLVCAWFTGELAGVCWCLLVSFSKSSSLPTPLPTNGAPNASPFSHIVNIHVVSHREWRESDAIHKGQFLRSPLAPRHQTLICWGHVRRTWQSDQCISVQMEGSTIHRQAVHI